MSYRNIVLESEVFFFRDLENHEVELVLPMGNVVDLTFIKVSIRSFLLFFYVFVHLDVKAPVSSYSW